MSRTQVWFDGVELTSLFLVSNLQQPLLPRKIVTSDVPGKDGELFLGASLATRTIKLTLTVRDRSITGLQEAARQLAAILNVSEPKPLRLSIDGGLYYMAVPNAKADGARYLHAIRYDVEFLLSDPVAYGDTQSVTVPSGGSVTFDVDGTYPTLPTITASAARNGSGGDWRITREDGAYVSATIPSGVMSAPVVIDCAERVLRVNSNVVVLPLEADWLVLEPGEHTLTMTGTGAATVEWTERWV